MLSSTLAFQPFQFMEHNKVSSTISRITKLIIILLVFFSFETITTDITDNTCTFKIKGKLFTLLLLNKASTTKYYTTEFGEDTVYFNFCDPFVPSNCVSAGESGSTLPSAYAFISNNIQSAKTNVSVCVPMTSSSKTSNYFPTYISNNGNIQLNLTMVTVLDSQGSQQRATFILNCSEDSDTSLKNVSVRQITRNTVIIYGSTPSACPVFQLSSIWAALSDNQLIFGIILFVIGFIMLFYGVLMIHLMIFLTAYFLSFAALMGLFTAILTPQSSRLAIYFSLLFILFLATLIAYGMTRLVNVSIFFIGAFFGFIVAALVNTIFSSISGVYSIWSLVFFELIFTIPFGLLTFKFSEQVIIVSTSLVGSYMIVRPISWIFGGFPNEFTLYDAFNDGKLKTIPWSFFLYLVFIIAIFILGALYQMLKMQKRNNTGELQTSYLPESVEGHLDRIHQVVEELIKRTSQKKADQNENYKNLEELKEKNNLGQELKPQAKLKQNDF